MKQWALDTLEFRLIKEMVKKYASSTVGKVIIEELVPTSQSDNVQTLLQETEEGMHLLRLKGGVSLAGVYDIRAALERANIAGILNEQECLEIASTIGAGRKIKSLLRQVEKEEIHLFPILKEITEQIVSLEELQHTIETLIDPQGFLRDDASQVLKHIRRQMTSVKQKVNETLMSILRSPQYSKMIQESLVTTRNNRYVIPVKQEYRSALKGIVHDQSSSGATLFMEPEGVFQLNNQLRELELEEDQERERILAQLTAIIAEETKALESNLQIVAKLDVILAKAEFGRVQKAICAGISSDQSIYLKKARHPLIPQDRVVPTDIILDEQRAMLITGPNAGGKTVILKTVGLFALMTQSGIPIPAQEESRMPIFNGIFADIGDEQSIEQSLSTFSGHLTNIIQILNHMDQHSLVLLDELGAGTDPAEGTALATSILKYVIEKGCTTITTTHYSELKYFAYNHPGAINASVEFDVKSLSPTYRLLIGTPGSSNAFAISQRLGLPREIIEEAKTYLSGEEHRFEKGIEHLQQALKEAEEERRREQALREKSAAIYEELHQQINQWEEQKVHIEQQTRAKAQKMVERAEKEIEEVLRQLECERTSSKLKEHHLIEAKTRLRKVIPEATSNVRQSPRVDIHTKINVGDEVFVYHLNQSGFILEKRSEDEYVVQVGALKMKLKRSQLEKKPSKAAQSVKKTVYSLTCSDNPISPEIHLRGKAIDEALIELEKYLDNVLLSGYKKVSIVHGKGTGALRIAVQNYLRQHRSVKEYRLGYHGEGGAGVTVVELD